MRNRWVAATTVILAALALSLVLLGSAPTGTVGASPLAVTVVSLASLTIFLLPLIALLLSFDAVVGEAERGTLLLLLACPVARWQVVLGKFLGHTAILALATVLGYGAAGALLYRTGGADDEAWSAFTALIGTSILMGAAFVALGSLVSIVVRERPTAAGLAVALWLFFVLLYDAALLGLLVLDQGETVTSGLLNLLLLLNPADVYRLINLTGHQAAALLAGMSAPGEAGEIAAGALSTRATLGHTGRELHSDRRTTLIYALVLVSALARIAAGLTAGAFLPSLALAGAAWFAAFALFLLVYGPMLFAPSAPRITIRPTCVRHSTTEAVP